MAVVAERIGDGEILHIIKMWLQAPVMEADQDGTKRNIGGGKGNRQGTPQGGVISPLLANLYLHLLDRIWERRDLHQRLGARIVKLHGGTAYLSRGHLQSAKIFKDLGEVASGNTLDVHLRHSYGKRPFAA